MDTDIREQLIGCFKDTISKIETDTELKSRTARSAAQTTVVNFSKTVVGQKRFDTQISVIRDTSFNAAKKLVDGSSRVAVLNFASAVNPGGGVTVGAAAQEECLCRSSNLYACLKRPAMMKDYYMPHRIANNSIYSNKVIYSKEITVFKSDDDVPIMLPRNAWFQVDVMTCAAPNLSSAPDIDKEKLQEVFHARINAILGSAYAMGADTLVLGAFGCGAFRNSPEMVSWIFKQEIENNFNGTFKKIVFAIKRGKNNNYDVFAETFKKHGETTENKTDDNGETYADTSGNEESANESSDNINTPTTLSIDPIEIQGAIRSEFDLWQQNNPYSGKLFSILGDSVSTLAGCLPNGYPSFYKGEVCKKSGVMQIGDTWWSQVISFFGGKLLVNNSYSGSKVSSAEASFPSGVNEERIKALAIGEKTPDVIIVNLGFNDWASGTELNATLKNKPLSSFFDYSYYNMLIRIGKLYPKAEIWCCTLGETFISGNSSFTFPQERHGTHIEKFNEVIRNAAIVKGRKLADVYKCGKIDTIDGSHPNANGMHTIAKAVCYSISEKAAFVECDEFFKNRIEIIDAASDSKGQEEKSPKSEKSQNKYVCKKCGEQLDADDKFCIICGTATDFKKADRLTAAEKTDKQAESDKNTDAEAQPKLKVKAEDKTPKKEKPSQKAPDIIDNRYKIIRKIGKGASSVVFLAQDIKLDRVCAVKMVNKSTYENKIAAQESLSEANKLKLLAHISIPQLYDIYDDDKMLCIVMEYIEGDNISNFLRTMTEPLDEGTIIDWFEQLCRVLYYLHTLKPPRIFRDLKPANVIIQPNGILKLIDFGTMKNYDPSRSEDTVNLGTKGYAAPEQFGGRGATDERTDIYGLGMTMYHIITGVNPSTAQFEIKPIPEYRPDISQGLVDIVNKCTMPEREKRYQKVSHIMRDLEDL